LMRLPQPKNILKGAEHLRFSLWGSAVVDQAEIHEMVISDDPDQRKRASVLFQDEFGRLEDKKPAWEDLHKLTQDKQYFVRQVLLTRWDLHFSTFQTKNKPGRICIGWLT
jgi:hypothetical protein